MLPTYLKTWEWEWIFGRAVKAISSLGVRSPWVEGNINPGLFKPNLQPQTSNPHLSTPDFSITYELVPPLTFQPWILLPWGWKVLVWKVWGWNVIERSERSRVEAWDWKLRVEMSFNQLAFYSWNLSWGSLGIKKLHLDRIYCKFVIWCNNCHFGSS